MRIGNLPELMKKDIARTKETLEVIEKALETLKDPKHIELWKSYEDYNKQHLDRVQKRLDKLVDLMKQFG